MNDKLKLFIAFAVILVFLVLLTIPSYLSGRISPNEEGVLGNSAGNIYNKGLYCEQDGVVYFSNGYDGGSLYSMNSDESNIKKLSQSQIEYINAAGKYLYYYQANSSKDAGSGWLPNVTGIFRSNLKGKKTVCLIRVPAMALTLSGNTIYYQHYDNKSGISLRRINIDKKDPVKIADGIMNPACIQDGIMYFNGTEEDHALYTLDTKTDQISRILDGNIWNPIVQGEYVYYMDISNNYRLSRTHLSSLETQVLSEERIEFFNLYQDIIYYQTNSSSSPALKRVATDGSNTETVAEGIYQNVNITSQYVYFYNFDAISPVYHTSTTGEINVTEFSAAAEAALAK